MTIKSKQLFILIGDDKTGKTTLQKLLIERVCGYVYATLPVNKKFNITHQEIKRKYQDISFANRSYQEKISDYGTIDQYFQNHFESSDIAFISSHLVAPDIEQMILNGKSRFYNVNAIFFSNSIDSNTAANAQISLLAWSERFVVSNPFTDNEGQMKKQLESMADSIVALLINRTSIS
jgi:hypothetical protein